MKLYHYEKEAGLTEKRFLLGSRRNEEGLDLFRKYFFDLWD
jgi:hypothetical protein